MGSSGLLLFRTPYLLSDVVLVRPGLLFPLTSFGRKCMCSVVKGVGPVAKLASA